MAASHCPKRDSSIYSEVASRNTRVRFERDRTKATASTFRFRFFRGIDPARDLGPDRAPWRPPDTRGAPLGDAVDPLRDEDDDDDDDSPPPASFLAGF